MKRQLPNCCVQSPLTVLVCLAIISKCNKPLTKTHVPLNISITLRMEFAAGGHLTKDSCDVQSKKQKQKQQQQQ
jgi:hypothetical protein